MKKIDVLFSSDNKYIDIMLASIYSFLVNSNFKNIRIHIIGSNFSLSDYNRIENTLKVFSNIELYFYPFENFNIDKYNIPNWQGLQIPNARLFFQEILKHHLSNIEHLLYLDSDTITLSDLTDLKNYANGLYACKDICSKKMYKNLPNITTYYNSGVIFINVKEWLENEYQQKIITFLNENSNINFVYPDQDILNCSLSSYIKELPISYNLPPQPHLFNDYILKKYFDLNIRNVGYKEIKEACKNVKIIHNYAYPKPWTGGYNPYFDDYINYILKINPDFEIKELTGIKKLILNNPFLLKTYLLSKENLPENMEKNIKSLILKKN